MDLDPLTLSRLQFALTIMFHYLFPPLSIGLGTMMVLMEGWYLWSKKPEYQEMTRFFTKLFAVNFAVGVATGVVMEFQFGTNWSRYSRFVGDVFGSALAAEGIFAFFLESGFLAVLVFGWDRVGPKMHFFATCMVALGSIFSAVWIVVANSWQQTPAGHHIVLHNGIPRAEIVDFWAMVFNPSSVDRLVHVILGAWILGAFFAMSVAAWYILRQRHEAFARRAFTLGLFFGLFSSLAMLVSGHFQARTVARTQPAKLAAFEAHFETGTGGTPMSIVGWPNVKERRLDYAIVIPKLLSFLVYDDFDRPVEGLDETPRADQPPVVIPFFTYHIMIGLGTYFIGVLLLALLFWFRGTLFQQRWLMWVFVVSVLGPYTANQAGWVAAEQGRQPWVVYKLLRTSDAYSPTVPGEHILASIVMFSLIYLLLFAVWLFVMNSKIVHGPEPVAEPKQTPPGGLLDAATRRGSPTQYSLTSAKEDKPQK
jgi:cytochrome d ubiquinol oxidase subunit I